MVRPTPASLVLHDVTHRHTPHLVCTSPCNLVVFISLACTTACYVESLVVYSYTEVKYFCFVRLPLQPLFSLKVLDEAGAHVNQYGRCLPQRSSHKVVRSRHRGLQQCAQLPSCVVHLHVSYSLVLSVPSTKHVDGVVVGNTSSSPDSMLQLTRCRPFVCLRVVSLDTALYCTLHNSAESVQRRVNDCHTMTQSG